jgi:hypothetical protein
MLSLGATLGPIVYAFEQASWDFSKLFTPVYSPPNVNFLINVKNVTAANDQLQTACELRNIGEVKIALNDVNANLFGPDEENLTSVNLIEPVISNPQSNTTFILRMALTNSVRIKLAVYLLDHDSIPLKTKGEAHISVLGSTVNAPFEVSFSVTKHDLGIP